MRGDGKKLVATVHMLCIAHSIKQLWVPHHTVAYLLPTAFLHTKGNLRGMHSYHKVAYYQPCSTVGEVIVNSTEILSKQNISEPKLSAEWMMAKCLGVTPLSRSPLSLYRSKMLTNKQIAQFKRMEEQRLRSKPLQYIIEDWSFYNIDLKVREPVFIPRPESEELVGHIISTYQHHREDDLLFIDIGCGSGAIGLALLTELPNSRCVAIDINPKAVQLSIENANHLHLSHRYECITLDISQLIGISKHLKTFSSTFINKCGFDFIVSNPPYVLEEEMHSLQPEIVGYEDLRALNGGVDGLLFVHKILKSSPHLLHDRGTLVSGDIWLEVDTSHPSILEAALQGNTTTNNEAASQMFGDINLKFVKSIKDFNGYPRFVQLHLN